MVYLKGNYLREEITIKHLFIMLASIAFLNATPTLEVHATDTTCTTSNDCDVILDDLTDDLNNAKQEEAKLEQEQATMHKEIQDLKIEIEDLEANLSALSAEQKETETLITKQEAEITQTENEIDATKDTVYELMILSQRETYQNPLLSLLSEDESLVTMIQKIRQYTYFNKMNQDMITDFKTLLAAHEKQLTTLATTKENLVSKQETITKEQATMETKVSELETLEEQLLKELEALEKIQVNKQEELEIVDAQKAALKQLEEQARLEALEKEQERLEALEKEEAEKEETSKPEVDSKPDPKPEVDSKPDPKPEVESKPDPKPDPKPETSQPTDTMFRLPMSSGYVSCEFACYSGHSGMDISNLYDRTTPILASASGIVTKASYHSGYGNHIIITHSINGKTFTTLYAHLSSMSVSVGQSVSAGQQIGRMGSSGNSTGAHLHFEIYEGYFNYGSAINPRRYLHFPSRW